MQPRGEKSTAQSGRADCPQTQQQCSLHEAAVLRRSPSRSEKPPRRFGSYGVEVPQQMRA